MHYYAYMIGIYRRCEYEHRLIIIRAIDDADAEKKLEEYYKTCIRDHVSGTWNTTELVWTSDCVDDEFTLDVNVFQR